MSMQSDSELAEKVDDFIEAVVADPTRASHVLAAIRVAMIYVVPPVTDPTLTEGAAILILDVLHAVTEEFLRNETGAD